MNGGLAMTPPETLDGAAVLFWAWSGEEPFFVMTDADGRNGEGIYGLAVCRYKNGALYRFSCDRAWEVVNDSQWPTAEDAKRYLPLPLEAAAVRWRQSRPASHA